MNSYVLLYHFDDSNEEQKFESEVRRVFWRNQLERDAGFKYIGFAAKEEPAVVDSLNGILNGMGYGTEGNFGSQNYVALYFSREKDSDNIKRQLLIGTDDMVDQDAQKMSADAHRDAIQNLLDFDYVKAMPEPPK